MRPNIVTGVRKNRVSPQDRREAFYVRMKHDWENRLCKLNGSANLPRNRGTPVRCFTD